MSEDIVDSWEDLEDNGELDKRLKNLVPTQSNSEESQKQTDGAASGVKLQEDNGGRTPYKPSVRILKREPNATGQNNLLLSARTAQSKPIRTLEEREAAYAEARLRILGSAESPQESNLNNGESAAAAASSSNSSGSAPVGKPSTDGAGSSSAAPAKGPTKDPSPSTSR